MKRTPRCLALAAALLLAPGVATLLLAPCVAAESLPHGLAPPGPCARISPETTLAPLNPVPARTALEVDPGIHLGAADVAAPGPGVPFVGSPQALAFPGTGACDRPGSGCTGPIRPTPVATGSGGTPSGGGRVIKESPSGPGGPPGVP